MADACAVDSCFSSCRPLQESQNTPNVAEDFADISVGSTDCPQRPTMPHPMRRLSNELGPLLDEELVERVERPARESSDPIKRQQLAVLAEFLTILHFEFQRRMNECAEALSDDNPPGFPSERVRLLRR